MFCSIIRRNPINTSLPCYRRYKPTGGNPKSCTKYYSTRFHGSTVKSPPGLGIGGEASRSEAFEYLIVVVCVNCVLHSPACLCVAHCPQLPRDNIQFVRKPTDFESARSSTPPLLRSIHEFFRLLSFLPSTICPSASPLFNFVPYILLS